MQKDWESFPLNRLEEIINIYHKYKEPTNTKHDVNNRLESIGNEFDKDEDINDNIEAIWKEKTK